MKNKNLIVTSESCLGFVHGEHELKSQRIWDIRKTPCIEYQGSLESISKEELIWFGLYAIRPINIFNIISGEIKTLSYMSSRIWTSSFRYEWRELTSEEYPIYNINNQYIGYVSNGKTNYTSLYKGHGNKYHAWFTENKRIIYIIISYFIFLVIIFTYFRK